MQVLTPSLKHFTFENSGTPTEELSGRLAGQLHRWFLGDKAPRVLVSHFLVAGGRTKPIVLPRGVNESAPSQHHPGLKT